MGMGWSGGNTVNSVDITIQQTRIGKSGMHGYKVASAIIYFITLFSLPGCSSDFPDESDVADAWVDNSFDPDKSRFSASAIKELSCHITSDKIIICDYSMSGVYHTNVFERSATGKWKIRNTTD